MKVTLLTGGADKPYALGLLEALISKGMNVDFIGSDDMSTSGLLLHSRVNFLNLRGDQNPKASTIRKAVRVLRYYRRLLDYASNTNSKIFHIIWLNKFLLFDRTLLILYYKCFGKTLVYTAHNIDERERDGGNSWINRASLRIFYSLMDHIFVHSVRMKAQLIREFYVEETKVSIIPFGINNTLPKSSLTSTEARKSLKLKDHEKVILFFGNIAPYKGLEYAISALDRLRRDDEEFRLVIAGPIKAGANEYWEELEEKIRTTELDRYILKKIQYVPDDDVEVFFKAADVLALPYRFIYQSGVLFLAYSFGLPVVAADVGSLREDIIEGKTGMIFRPEDAGDMAEIIRRYFDSDLFRNIDKSRKSIMDYGNEKYSWEKVGNITSLVYQRLAKEF